MPCGIGWDVGSDEGWNVGLNWVGDVGWDMGWDVVSDGM